MHDHLLPSSHASATWFVASIPVLRVLFDMAMHAVQLHLRGIHQSEFRLRDYVSNLRTPSTPRPQAKIIGGL